MPDDSILDVVIVGSGPAGVHAAYPLVEGGVRVAIIDGGVQNTRKQSTCSDEPSPKSNPYDLLLKTGRVFTKTYKLLKIKSNIEIIQSLGKGGLSEIWHGICDYFTDSELGKIGLPVDAIRKEYQEVANRIKLKHKPPLDLHGKLILEKSGNRVYRLPIAYPYRTSQIVEGLKRHQNFSYVPEQLVIKVKGKNKWVEIESISTESQKKLHIQARYLILAAGAINTTRILLRSLDLYNCKVPFLTKGHTMFICLNLGALTKRPRTNNTEAGQVSLVCNELDRGLNSFFVQFYRCNPLASEMALRYIPLPKQLASLLFSIIAPYLVIVDIRFPTFVSSKSFCRLKRDSHNNTEVLEISSPEIVSEIKKHKEELKKIKKQILSFGLLPFKTITSGVTSHYAGGVTHQEKPGRLSTDSNGKLRRAKRVYIADSSIWGALPAKPPTLTIMANASRVGKHVLQKLNHHANQ